MTLSPLSLSRLVRPTYEAVVLSGVLAQSFEVTRQQNPFDCVSIVQFTLFAALTAGPNFFWQQWIENIFLTKTRRNSRRDGTSSSRSESLELDTANIAKKFALDQTFGAVVNMLLFFVPLGKIKGHD